ncbi:MAG: Undecaprenyl-diphosphatase [uncultured Thermoleophilia bacterium]|uniref:Undecaprenyl-diphosphatase n=1 Tax=uncultured Thermoleophilia bacterium TaxID=1497501 RepID=A0A6J4TPK6_9ACTN|nr:MAG: Undecaprenyl-diphosphatase [uncultured Thermoleophilia bacterium]
MGWIEAIVLGVVQGLTEFLPISSTAHLRIVPAFFGWDDPGAAFTAVTQLGTMAAVLLFFRQELWAIAVAWLRGLTNAEHRRTRDSLLGWYILVGTIPIGVFGLLFADQIETGARNLTLIGITLIALGVLLFIADRTAAQRRTADDLTWRDGVLIGLAQACALVPGVSRSGATITAGLFLGLGRADAARYSFLLSVPAVVLSGLFQLGDIGQGDGPSASATAIATVLAFVSGYASIAFLLRFLVSNRLTVFVGYRIVLGVAVLVLVAAGTID